MLAWLLGEDRGATVRAALASATVVLSSNLTLLECDRVLIRAEAVAFDRTGVEMEALTAVSVSALTLYDMVKGVDRGAVIESVRLVSKDGGRSGPWSRDG